MAIEAIRCKANPVYFCHYYCRLRDESGDWIPFRLWNDQAQAMRTLTVSNLVIWLKARQLGMTWLALAYCLWTILFRPGGTQLLFSLREEEACELLDRLRGMFNRLPKFLQPSGACRSNGHELHLTNGSRVKAFPTNRGDSYTATLAIVDEADLVPDLDRLLGSVKPTIDAGGKLLLLSRVDKSKPQSSFKNIYRAARDGKNKWSCLFLPWNSRPSRTREWYEEQKQDVLSRTGSLDDLYAQYPETDMQALAPRQLDKRIPMAWLELCYQPAEPVDSNRVRSANHPPMKVPSAPTVPGLIVYQLPKPDGRYIVSCDPAEGNPTSDDSASCTLDAVTGEQVAVFYGKLEPGVMANYCEQLALWYNRAPVMVERNNHGHAVILALRSSNRIKVLNGYDGRLGWLSSPSGKVMLYTSVAEAIRDQHVTIHHWETLAQLASIEGSSLRAPDGEHDDLADAAALAIVGIPQANRPKWGMNIL